MTTAIAFALIGITCLIFFALAAFGCSARADALAEQQQRDRQRSTERLGRGGFHNIHSTEIVDGQ